MSSTNFSNFAELKDAVLSKRIGRKQISLSEIQILSDAAVEINGLVLALNKDAFKSLLRIVGITNQLRKNIIKEYGDAFADRLVSILGKSLGTSKGNVVLLIDIKKKTILNIVQNANSMISNEVYLDNVEKVISGNKLEIDSMSVRSNGGFNISTIGDNTEWGLRGVENNESFKFGLNFENDPVKGTKMMPYNQRLVCTNGMIEQNFVGVTQLVNTEDSWNQFFGKIDKLKESNFRPIEFAGNLKSVMNSSASVSELISARNILKSNSLVEDDHLEKYAPIESTYEAYSKKGIIIDTLNKDEKQNAFTDVSYWELINGLTDFASHDYGYSVKNSDNIQRFAGKMFSKKPDLTNLVVNPF
jgi:hypothetical protein